MTRTIAWLVFAAMVATPHTARSDAIPAYLQVTGSGTTHVRVYVGTTLPCDALSNAILYDGYLEAGRTYVLASPEPMICELHTYGGFRETQWSAGAAYAVWPGHWWFDVPISTDE